MNKQKIDYSIYGVNFIIELGWSIPYSIFTFTPLHGKKWSMDGDALRASPTHSIFHSKIEFKVKNALMVLYFSLYNRVKNRFTPNIE